MPFSIRSYRRLPLPYLSAFWLLITLLVLSSGPVYAEWVEVLKNQTDATLYVDSDMTRRKGNMVKWWDLLDYKTVQTVAGISFLSAKTQREFDCAEEQIRILAMTYFSGNMGRGPVVFSDSTKNDWEPVEPESRGYTMWKVACSKK